MLFNSFEFAVFLPLVFFLYWFVFQRSLKVQNGLLVAASLVFYGWWDVRFLAMLVGTCIIDFFLAQQIAGTENKRQKKMWLAMSVGMNLGLLGFFKYFNFFVDSFCDAFTIFGYQLDRPALHVILPVGISFYTFQEVSYTIDVYRGSIKPTRSLPTFLAFVSFFPQLVAGPIQRAHHLMPQFLVLRKFDYELARDGLRQILWGMFKKIVVADTCAIYANDIFGEGYKDQPGSVLLVGAFYFAFQIYGDFSGYSDIAIGTSKLFGFRLMRNFAYPYFSRDMAEFWRRWHISLSTWFRDYLYFPLGGSKGSLMKTLRNTIIIFVVSGLWHGANWTFITWGALNALYFIPLLLTDKNRSHLGIVAEHSHLPSLKEFFQILFTFFLTMIAWIFFRAESVPHALHYIGRIFSMSFFDAPPWGWFKHVPLVAFLVCWEWVQRRKHHGLEFGPNLPMSIRWTIYILFSASILYFFGGEQVFIYFQF